MARERIVLYFYNCDFLESNGNVISAIEFLIMVVYTEY